jgi:putative inorganic carbon (hco3(-)) transporter
MFKPLKSIFFFNPESEVNKKFWLYSLTFLFIAIICLCIGLGFFYINLLPFLLLIILSAFLAMDSLWFLTLFFVPLSVQLSYFVEGLPVDLSLPTEPLLFGVMLVFFFQIFAKQRIDRRIMNHPLTIALLINLIWLFATAVTSTMILVSLKFVLARIWFLVAFYFLACQLFANYKNISKFFWIYIIPFSLVIIYTIIHQSITGLFDKDSAYGSAQPFTNDHTSFAVILALYIPILFGITFNPQTKKRNKLLSIVLLLLYLFALVISYTRAAWLSLAIAFVVWLIVKLKIKFKYVALSFLGLLVLFFVFSTQIFTLMEHNRQDSSKNMSEHLESMSNVKTDASNVERINRWKCALRMFVEKPLIGWGPGTYMFQYAPFQKESEKTIISTNLGEVGNSHSEYLGPLSESGILGLITFLYIIGWMAYTGIKVYRKSKDPSIRIISLSILIGLLTYFIHGIMNDFLNTDKASAPFWGFAAVLVALDIYHTRNSEKDEEATTTIIPKKD